jgi:putative transposase
VRRRGGRKRALGTRAPMTLPQGPNQRWSLDFLGDALSDGRRIRILAVVDDFTRECLALVADTSLPGLRVVRERDVAIAWRGRPAMCVSDNGTELTGMAVLRFSQERQIEWHYIAPGKSTQNVSRVSTPPGCATNSSTRRRSPRSRRFERCWRPRPHSAWAISHRRNTPMRRPRTATGRDAALRRGLRAPPRCSTEPIGLKYHRDSPHRWMKHGAQTLRLHRSDGTTRDNKGEAVNAFAGPMTTSHTAE